MTEPEQDSADSESNTIPIQDDTTPPGPTAEVDLDAIEKDLTGVEVALSRLADGTYWTDEVTGSPIPDQVLAADPIARRT